MPGSGRRHLRGCGKLAAARVLPHGKRSNVPLMSSRTIWRVQLSRWNYWDWWNQPCCEPLNCANVLWQQQARRSWIGIWMKRLAVTSLACLQPAPSCAVRYWKKRSDRSCPPTSHGRYAHTTAMLQPWVTCSTKCNDNLPQTYIDGDFLALANQVNGVGRKAGHQGLLSEDEARGCLQSTRQAMQLLLRD